MRSNAAHFRGGIVRQNHTLARLRQGKPAIGLWLQTHSFHMARIIAAQGLLDWLLVDMEHTPVDLSVASTFSLVAAAIKPPSDTKPSAPATGSLNIGVTG